MDKLRVIWDNHANEKNFGHHWQTSERELNANANGDIDNSDDDEDDAFMKFTLPDDKGFNEDRPWKQQSRMPQQHVHQENAGHGGGDDDRSNVVDDDDESNEGMDYRYDEIDESVNLSRRKRPCDSIGSDNDADDDFSERSERTPTKSPAGNDKWVVTNEKHRKRKVV